MSTADHIMRVRVPATSANLGAGFDTLGMALSLYNIFDVMRELPPGQFVSEAIGEGMKELTDLKANMVVSSYIHACEAWGVEGKGFALRSHNVIPLARGLGSSAGAVVAGVMIANELNGLRKSKSELICEMTTIEGHPDNVAPCFLGGMIVSAWNGRELAYVKLQPLPSDVHVVVAVPDVLVSTVSAREALPEKVDFRDAVFNVSRAALLTAAWAEGKWDLLSSAMDDRLHQQYRAKLFPGGEDVMTRVREIPGCLGVAISGSGPSILAIARGKPARVAEAMCGTFAEHGTRSLFFVLEGCAEGARIEIPEGGETR